jgi:Domain of unknown function (DUF4349)
MKRIKSGRRRLVVIIAGVAVLALIVAAAVIGAVHPRGGTVSYSADQTALTSQAAEGTADRQTAGSTDYKAVPAPTAASAASGSSNGSGTVSADLPPAPNGQYLVRIGSMTVVVAKGRLDQSVKQIFTLTRLYDGYVLSSYAGTESGQPLPVESGTATDVGAVTAVPERSDAEAAGTPYAYITIRVPSERFEQAVVQFRQLGSVKALTTSTEDVTGQVVDLRARLRHYRAVEARLLSFLDKATSVGSALAVQNRIDQTQLQIEELQAQLKQLSETVTYSTLSVTLTEKGHPVVAGTTGSRGFWGTIRHSFALMGDGFAAIFTAFAAALPFLLLIAAVAVVVWLAVRAVLRRRHHGSPAPSHEGM